MSGAGRDEGDLVREAQNMWSMLDELAAADPSSYQRFLHTTLAEARAFHQQAREPPEPHMCVSTHSTKATCEPLFVNVCSWVRVPEPKCDDDPVPIISSDLCHLDGVAVVSVALAPSVVRAHGLEASVEDRAVLVDLALDYMQDVHGVSASRRFSVLPASTTFYGPRDLLLRSLTSKLRTDHSQDAALADIIESFPRAANLTNETITDLNKLRGEGETDNFLPRTPPGKALIEELESVDTPADVNTPADVDIPADVNTPADVIAPADVDSRVVEEPSYRLRCASAGAGEPRRLVLSVDLDRVTSVAECQLDLTQTKMLLDVPGRYRLVVRLPEPVRDEWARAKFSKKTRALTLTLPTAKS